MQFILKMITMHFDRLSAYVRMAELICMLLLIIHQEQLHIYG